MSSTIPVRVASFNVNQHDSVANIKADLEARMALVDVLLLQETVTLDVVAFAKKHPGWAGFQVRNGDNDGHANTAVLWRTAVLGEAEDTACVFIGDAPDTRRRFLTAVKLKGTWFVSWHVFPARDTKEITDELAHVKAWCDAHRSDPQVHGLDKNQASVGALVDATGLQWHGVDIDGFLGAVARVHEFPKGHSDHAGVHGVTTITVPAPHHKVRPPHPPYLGPAAHTSVGENKPIHRVVIHSTVSPCKPGGARDIARYFNSPAAGGSAHYIVDPGEVVQDVYDSLIAWHAPGADWSATHHPEPESIHSVGIEMCDIPGPKPGDGPGSAAWKAAKRVWRWNRPEQQQMLDRTAKLTARLCAAYDVPPVWLSPRALQKGHRGITSHNNVSRTFHRSTHWDPGFWPRRHFMRLVRKHYKELTS